MGPSKLLVSGLDSSGHIQRSILRFATVDEAKDTVVEFENLGIEGLTPDPLLEEIQCQIRILVPKELLWLIAALVLPYVILLAAVQVVGLAPFVGTVFLGMFLVLLLSRGFWLRRLVGRMLRSTNPLFFRNVKGSLAIEEQKLRLKPYYYYGSTAPTIIEWRSPSIFLIKIGRTEYQLTFPTSEDAAKASLLVKTSFPEVQETWMTNP